MVEWIEQNKDWVFSGAGVAVITSCVAVLSAIITYLARSFAERKQRKRLGLQHELKQYRVEAAGKDDPLQVSYKGKSYPHLCQFTVSLKNIGTPSVSGQQLLFRLPNGAEVLDVYEKFSTQLISAEKQELTGSENLEHVYTLNKLENGDTVAITYMLNTDRPEEVMCEPRGVDDADYARTGSEADEVSIARKLIAFAALFLIVGIIPFLEDVLRAAILLVASPTIITFIQQLRIDRDQKHSCVLNDVTVQEGGEINVMQK